LARHRQRRRSRAGPRRLAWIYVPNGIDMQTWTPAKFGADYELTPTLKTLAAYRDKMLVISGLVCDKANPNGDGPGDHARANAAYLTGVQPQNRRRQHPSRQIRRPGRRRTDRPSDQICLAGNRRGGRKEGRTDSGYSLAYSHNLSWRNETTPMTKDCDPQSVFDRLFSNGDPRETAEARARREHDQTSVLDFVLQDANRFQNKLSAADRNKMDEYLTSVREIELRIQRAASAPPPPVPAGAVRPPAYDSSTERKVGISSSSTDYDHHAKLMIDMMVLAFQADLTRVITLPFADEGSNQTYPWADANVPTTALRTTWATRPRRPCWPKSTPTTCRSSAYLLDKLDKIKEGNGSVLDNSLIAYGSGNSDGRPPQPRQPPAHSSRQRRQYHQDRPSHGRDRHAHQQSLALHARPRGRLGQQARRQHRTPCPHLSWFSISKTMANRWPEIQKLKCCRHGVMVKPRRACLLSYE
jgi:hypothetical protein